MVAYKTYKVRLYPTKEQEAFLAQSIGCARFIYNYLLSYKVKVYENEKRSASRSEMYKEISALKNSQEYKWLEKCGSRVFAYAISDLSCALDTFFKKEKRFPKFRSKKRFNSFSTDRVKVDDRKIKIPLLKSAIKFRGYKCIPNYIVKVTIKKDKTGAYYASIVCQISATKLQKTNAFVGIDMGIKNLIITSDGKKVEKNSFFKKYEIKIAKAQRNLSRKLKGSKSFDRQKTKIARLYKRANSCKTDKLHKLSTILVKKYDVICIEDLSIEGLRHSRKLSKHISYANWRTLIDMIAYKSELRGRKLVKVGRFYPSSKTCSSCGFILDKLSLNERIWICPQCGKEVDRDINAAENILKEGLRILSQGDYDV